jgi:fumarate hydratase class II
MITTMSGHSHRIARDSMGELAVPADALWGAQTQRAVLNFRLSGERLGRELIEALGLIKECAATANESLGLLAPPMATAIATAAARVAAGEFDAHFPVDVYQTGSGTSSNMNANEVVASLASSASGLHIHPNDHVNLGQSSNDTIPTAIHVAAALTYRRRLAPALEHLSATIERREQEFTATTKTGRTHLMDAMPLTLAQELSAWRAQLDAARARFAAAEPRLFALAQGGTAIGTGINCHPDFGPRFCAALAQRVGLPFTPAANYFAALAMPDGALEFSGHARVLATSLMKIANDLRWMNSGPLAGLGEIALPALQPGSSIMPGKVNPVIPEAVAMVAAQVMGYDTAIGIAAQSGSFQLNVMLPLIGQNLVLSLKLLANASGALADQAIAGFSVNGEALKRALELNPVLVTALNPVIGYDRAAAIAKRAYAESRPVLEVAREMSGLSEAELRRLLDPHTLTQGGLTGGASGGGG